MNEAIYLTIIEIFCGLIIEGVMLSMVFAYISNRTSEKQNASLQQEMANIETQNKFTYEQIVKEIHSAKTEIISQIKEAHYEKGGN
jgi:predicted solute-binding protein